MSNYKRKRRKIKTFNGYLPGDGPRGNSKVDRKASAIRQELDAVEQLQEINKPLLQCAERAEEAQDGLLRTEV